MRDHTYEAEDLYLLLDGRSVLTDRGDSDLVGVCNEAHAADDHVGSFDVHLNDLIFVPRQRDGGHPAQLEDILRALGHL